LVRTIRKPWRYLVPLTDQAIAIINKYYMDRLRIWMAHVTGKIHHLLDKDVTRGLDVAQQGCNTRTGCGTTSWATESPVGGLRPLGPNVSISYDLFLHRISDIPSK
jgi:hypothetical protein